MAKTVFHICEYGIIRCKEEYDFEGESTLDELYIDKKYFDSLYNYVILNQEASSETEKAFSIFAKGKKRQIKVKNYVGVIETKQGLHLEILPKIVDSHENEALAKNKKIFLRMIRHLKNSPFINLDKAHVDKVKNFPVLEIFIQMYVNEVIKLFGQGIKSDYIPVEGNLTHLRGKLNITQNIRQNHTHKNRFYCEYSEYSADIPINRIIKTTLLKLLKTAKNAQNIFSINKILSHIDMIPSSANIRRDLQQVNTQNRLYANYKTVIQWSEIFLTNASFSHFAGENISLSILFPMHRIFEDYIAHLFHKYADTHRIKIQDKSYFLVQKHKDLPKFSIRPDVVVEKELERTLLVDTKWKLIDQYNERKNYNITQADMYQLYAYGKKYTKEDISPRLILLYPANSSFLEKLPSFIYEGDLTLAVIPFSFEQDEQIQIENMLQIDL